LLLAPPHIINQIQRHESDVRRFIIMPKRGEDVELEVDTPKSRELMVLHLGALVAAKAEELHAEAGTDDVVIDIDFD
jgi:hypothetical protein